MGYDSDKTKEFDSGNYSSVMSRLLGGDGDFDRGWMIESIMFSLMSSLGFYYILLGDITRLNDYSSSCDSFSIF